MGRLVGLFRRLGPHAKRYGWNREFQQGAWFSGKRSPEIIDLLEQYGENARIVELGCGDGSLARHIQHVAHISYIGLDISDLAIDTARKIGDSRYSFSAGAIEDWQPVEPFDLLIMEECLYYLSAKDQDSLLEQALDALAPQGCAIFTFSGHDKHQATIDRVRQSGRVLADRFRAGRTFLVVAPADSPDRTS